MEPLRILTWNLWHGLNPYQKLRMSPMESRQAHRDRYRRQQEALSAWDGYGRNVLCFQEVNPLSARFDVLSAALRKDGGCCLVNSGIKLGSWGLPRGLSEGLAIFADDEVEGCRYAQLTLSGGGLDLMAAGNAPLVSLQTAERRKALLLEAELEHRRIAVVNLHLHHGPDTGAANLARKTAEVERLLAWLEPKSAGTELIVICGDFNCEADSPAMAPLRRAGFADTAMLSARDKGRAPASTQTWDPAGNASARLSAELADTPDAAAWDGAAHGFDRIYVRARGTIEVRGHGILREPELSDHYAVWAEIVF